MKILFGIIIGIVIAIFICGILFSKFLTNLCLRLWNK